MEFYPMLDYWDISFKCLNYHEVSNVWKKSSLARKQIWREKMKPLNEVDTIIEIVGAKLEKDYEVWIKVSKEV
jgi:hypothetical protein